MRLGGLEIALIVGAIILIFGVGKLANVGGALGKSIREFRRERDRKDNEDSSKTAMTESKDEKRAIQPEARAEQESKH